MEQWSDFEFHASVSTAYLFTCFSTEVIAINKDIILYFNVPLMICMFVAAKYTFNMISAQKSISY